MIVLVLCTQILTLILLYQAWKRLLSPWFQDWLTKHRRGVWYILWPALFGFWGLLLQSVIAGIAIASTSELAVQGILWYRAKKRGFVT